MKKCKCPAWAPKIFGYKLWQIFTDGSCHLLFRLYHPTGTPRSKKELEFMGILTPNGYLTKDEKVIQADKVKEYGFTNAVLYLCSEVFKNFAGADWLKFLLAIIGTYSPNSYLLDLQEKKTANVLPALRMRLEKDIPVPLEELYKYFGNLTYLEWDGKKIVTPMNEQQKKIATELGITHMEVFNGYCSRVDGIPLPMICPLVMVTKKQKKLKSI